MATIATRLCVLIEVQVLTHWWPWEHLLLGFFVRYTEQFLLLRQTVFAVRYVLKLKKQLSIEHVIQHSSTKWQDPLDEINA
jgi:hypothetical protein